MAVNPSDLVVVNHSGPPTRESIVLTLKEPIQKDAVHWLIQHVDEYVEEQKRDQVKGILFKTLACFEGDSLVLVEYHRTIVIGDGAYGRIYSNGAGFQMLWKAFRGALVRHSMQVYGLKIFDIDMKNAHPTLFVQLCRQHDVVCEDNYIERYLLRRERYLKMVCDDTGCDRGAAKTLFLSIINYQTVDGWKKSSGIEEWDEDSHSYIFAKSYKESFRALASGLMDAAPHIVELAKKWLKSKGESTGVLEVKKAFITLLLTSTEDDVLMSALEHLNSVDGLEVITCQYDGCIVKSAVEQDQIDLDALNKHVRQKTGFDVTWEFKEFDDTIKIPAFCKPLVTYKDIADLLVFENRGYFEDLRYDPVSGGYYKFLDGIWTSVHYQKVLASVELMVKDSPTLNLPENGKHRKSFWSNTKHVCDIAVRELCLHENFAL